MAEKFYIGPKHVYEIWDNKERLQQRVIPSQLKTLSAITASENIICDTGTESSSSEVLEEGNLKEGYKQRGIGYII
ncbi:13825_t:CDS:2 [Gigaspora margarita]|uniref:13825_t:CDS:1 n=1 Tax=Gigaspora margarita TaxID=4874 RepID=A0ABN7WMS8_GIGMA|nr:13825_t:CDS:2 [Gigaspora margarita]